MKRNLILLLLLITIGAQAQNLEQLISKDSKAVVEISGDQIFSLISHADLQMLMPPSPDGAPLDLGQYGFDVSAKAYYFYQDVNGVAVQNMVVKLSDPAKAVETISSMAQSPATKVNGYDMIIQDNMTAAWNSNTAIFSYADFPKKVYTMEDLIAEKEQENTDSSGEDLEMKGDGMDMEDSEQNLELELLIKNMDAPAIYSPEEVTDILMGHLKSIIAVQPNQSIAQNTSYKSGKNSTSTAYFWLNNLDELVKENYGGEFTGMIPSMSMLSEAPDMITGIQEMSANLIFNKDEIRLDTKLGIDPKVAPSYRKMYSSKMDKAFFKHFNQDEAMSYISFTSDMTAAMKEYPQMMQTLYGSWMPDYKEEIGVASDLLEVILDEEAIGELITGDGMIVLHEIGQQEVTYMATEYDDDFNATQVEKTKMEPTPIFSVMLGSKNQKIIGKLMKLARKYEVASNQGTHHMIASKNMGAPFDMYMTHQDGIMFLTNSTAKIANYSAGKKNCNLGKHKKMLKNNIFTMYLDGTSMIESLSSMIPADPNTIDYIKNNYKEMYMTMGQMEGNKVGYDMIIKTNGSQGNSLKLILDSFKTMQGM